MKFVAADVVQLGSAVTVASMTALLVWLRVWHRRKPGVLLDLIPPEAAQADLERWTLFFQGLFAIAHPWWKRSIVGQRWGTFELRCDNGHLTASCWVPRGLEHLVSALAGSALPGIDIRPSEYRIDKSNPTTRARLRLHRDPLYPLAGPSPIRLNAVLGVLAAARNGVVQISISPDVGWQTRALRRVDQSAGLATDRGPVMNKINWLVDSLFHVVLPESNAARKQFIRSAISAPPKDKALQPAFRADIRLRVSAATHAEAKTHIHALVAAFRTFDGANGLRPVRVWLSGRFDDILESRSSPGLNASALNAEELANLFHLPSEVSGFEVAPTHLAPSRRTATAGKVVCLLDDTRRVPIAISEADARHHIHVLGPTGAGKSTFLLNLALDDIESGRGVGVIDPKGDLVRALLERIHRRHWDRVALIDPSLRDRPVGLNVLDCEEADLQEIACDQLVTIFRKAYERFWGPRTDDLLRAAILTLLHRPGSTLCEVPLLLLHPAARYELVKGLIDPVGLGPFWEEYERLGESQRLQMVGPVLNKLRSVLLRRTVRNIMGQARSTIDLRACLDNCGILLISLAKGLIGEDTSRLLGAFLVARIWQTAMGRASRSEAERRDFVLYLDEFQNYLHLPQSLDEVLVEARGYRLGLVLANQHLGQLSAATRDALAANARTRVIFQCGQDDARYLSREFRPWLNDLHLRNLQRFQVAVRLCQDGRTERPFTGITRPEPPSLGEENATALTDSALKRFGRARMQVERAIERRLATYREPVPDRRKATADGKPALRDGVRDGVHRAA